MEARIERTVPTVLVVDDDATLRRSAQQSAGAAWSVRVARDVDSALAAFAANRPHFVIVDIVLGAERGLTLVREMKQVAPRLPIAAISGKLDVDRVFEAFAAGVAIVVEKPVLFREILSDLKALAPTDLDRRPQVLASRERARRLNETSSERSFPLDSRPTLAEARRMADRALIGERLERNNWNISETARDLGIQRSSLNAIIAKLAIARDIGENEG